MPASTELLPRSPHHVNLSEKRPLLTSGGQILPDGTGWTDAQHRRPTQAHSHLLIASYPRLRSGGSAFWGVS
jgi:hypothetical protein